jgi:hypothetical protein
MGKEGVGADLQCSAIASESIDSPFIHTHIRCRSASTSRTSTSSRSHSSSSLALLLLLLLLLVVVVLLLLLLMPQPHRCCPWCLRLSRSEGHPSGHRQRRWC